MDSLIMHSKSLHRAGDAGRFDRALDALLAFLALSGRILRRALAYLENTRRYSVTVRELRSLDERTLRDIGVERDEIVDLADRLSRGRHLD